jgi:hypothetical protein
LHVFVGYRSEPVNDADVVVLDFDEDAVKFVKAERKKQTNVVSSDNKLGGGWARAFYIMSL